MTVQLEREDPTEPAPAPAAVAPGGLSRRFYAGVAVVLAGQALVVGWYAARSFFFVDDFLFLRQGKDADLSASFLRQSLFEHFSPVHRFADWAFIRAAGPSWPAAATVLVVLTLSCTIAFAAMVTAFTRDERVAVATTAVYALSLFFLRTSLWWTAGVHILSVTLFSMVAIGAYARWHAHRRTRTLVLSFVGMALALSTHELALLLIGTLALCRLLLLAPLPRSVRDVVAIVRDEWPAWLGHGLLTAVAAWNFLSDYWQRSDRPPVGDVLHYLWMSIAEGFLATLFLVKVPEQMIGSPRTTGLLALAAGLAIVGATVVLRRGTWRAWVFFGVAFLVTVLPLGLSRVTTFGPTIGRDPIYQLAPAYLFLLALAVIAGAPRRTDGSHARSSLRALTTDRARLVRLAVVGLLGLAYVARYVHAAGPTADGTWDASGTKAYYEQVRDDVEALRRAGTPPVLFDATVADRGVPAWLFPYNRYHSVIDLMVPGLTFDTAEAAWAIDEEGHLVALRAEERWGADTLSAPLAPLWTIPKGEGCVAPPPGGGTWEVALPAPLTDGPMVVHLDYVATAAATGIVAAGGTSREVSLGPGGAVYAFVEVGPVAAVTVHLPGPEICLRRVAVDVLVGR